MNWLHPKIWLICLFALLQCIAPLAHAHLDGNNADDGLHDRALSGCHTLQSTSFSLPESAAIGMPEAFPRNGSLDIATAPPLHNPTLPPREDLTALPGLRLSPPVPATHLTSSPPPLAHAPPRPL